MEKRRLLYHFYDKSYLNKQQVKEYISESNKKILFTLGLDYKKPCHFKENITSKEAIDYINNYSAEVYEYEDYIYVHCYTGNDLY